MRLLAALSLLVACTAQPVEPPVATQEPAAELGAAPPVGALGWVSVEGPVELAPLRIRDEAAPTDRSLLEERGDLERTPVTLCESPDDRLRDETYSLITALGDEAYHLGWASPGDCYGPAWCAWALDQVREPPEHPADRLLRAQMSRCTGAEVAEFLARSDVHSATDHALWETNPDRTPSMEVFDEAIRRVVEEGDDILLGVLVVDAEGHVDLGPVRDRLLEARRTSYDLAVRDTLGRALGSFPHPDAREAWQGACRDDTVWGCESVGEAPLIVEEDLGARLVGLAGRTGTYGLRPMLAKARLDGIPDQRLAEGLASCVTTGEDAGSAEVCLESLIHLFPEEAQTRLSPALRRTTPPWPHLRRRLRALRLGPQGTRSALVEAGLLQASSPSRARRPGADPVLHMLDAGAGASVWEDEAPLRRVDLLRRMFFLLGVRAVVDIAPSDPYRPVAWVHGRRFEATLNRSAVADSVNAASLAAFANAVASALGEERRLLVQPGHTALVQTHVVVGTTEALQRGIDAGLLTAPAPTDVHGWHRRRQAARSAGYVEDWDSGEPQ